MLNGEQVAENSDLEGENTNTDGSIDVRSLMSEIRKRTEGEMAGRSDARLSFEAHRADFQKKRKAGEILHSPELRYLNENYHYAESNSLNDIASHRKGPIGRVIELFKRKLAVLIWEGILKSYFEKEKQFQSHLVRLLNDQARYIDERDAAAFWELVHKVDVDLSKAIERTERLHDEYVALCRSNERALHDTLHQELTAISSQIGVLRSALASQGQEIKTLSSVASGLEGIVSRISKAGLSQAKSAEPSVGDSFSLVEDLCASSSGADYILLENRFRGSEEEIQKRLEHYVELLKGDEAVKSNKPILDIGCGRGELLSLLNNAGLSAYGVDLDPAMIAAAKERGVDASVNCGFKTLANLDDNSLGGIIAIQVVEHLTPEKVKELSRLAYQKLVPGGRVVFETINPRSLLALSSNYFRDPTHIFPQHPDTLAYILTLSGFNPVELMYLSKVPEDAQLKAIPTREYMTPQWHLFVEGMNANIQQLNDLIYGYQDYAATGIKSLVEDLYNG